ncbi:MAG: hypothetical protein KAJ36_04530 [Candidatus Thorarchaeota archaeon]|nr:hypothetical protein [Candidatus Thorarchaeota archaeon]
MSDDFLTKDEILSGFLKILDLQQKISDYVDRRLCGQFCDQTAEPEVTQEEWTEMRKKILTYLRSLMDKYMFTKKLPRDDLGIMTLAVIEYFIRIQHTFAQVLVILDSLRGDSFGEIYMDSLTTISSKVNEQIGTLKHMIEVNVSDPESVKADLEQIIKLERQIDEDNIVICRQISVKTAGGDESDFSCYMMRKIVAELEHISDYVKECAEILADF